MLDKHIPTSRDRMDMISPPVGSGHSGQLTDISYTEEVVVSSPITPTLEILKYRWFSVNLLWIRTSVL